MERDYAATLNANGENDGTEYAYPEGYSDADYYYPQQQGGDEGEEHYASYHQGWYEDNYSQQEGGQEGADLYQYPSSYDTNAEGAYDVANSAEAQEYNYYTTGEESYEQQLMYATEAPETWTYSPEEGQHLYLDQLTTEQAAGYYYDEEGNLIDGYGERESPTNVFNQETYWESSQGGTNLPYAEDATSPVTRDGSPHDEADTTSLGLTESTPLASTTTEDVTGTPPRKMEKKGSNARAASPSRKKKTKKERIAERQALLEKEEEERLKAQEASEAAGANDCAPAAATKMSTLPKKKAGFVDHQRTTFHMKLRIAKAIKRNRMPVQIRILPTVLSKRRQIASLLARMTNPVRALMVDSQAPGPNGEFLWEEKR
ncbi:hypothetical protein PHYPSEUDO_011103 [Phytophthora pseudosyringae]|uniref:Uncharacterized protein n=1 Tax=Phytophthora pseudosyringae TaxID=221518 RepID=A0A8T1W6Z1_9STRA|nr:hypothetical protein PHYPSEUDO_011103 [Phytophthora pseudosyringae]